MTQEYTPVAWQDETTSQQGTLINAERLNQMQTAHHYADGFEEVDAVPTANPGVEYHKIVYCTADSTIYRWDGTEWTADIDDETKRLLEQEIARATAAESTLRGQLEDEHDARVDAETAINDRITDEATELGQRIATEASTRYTADTALGTRITNETSARETADTGLGNRITAEATARADADTALGGRIDTEQARATAAEQANAQAIANTYTKAEIDTALGAKADQATTYTKVETDTLLGAKADQATTYTKTEVQTYVSNALDGYLPMVRTTGNQAIGGVKDFTTQLLVTGLWDNKVSQNLENGSTWRRIYYTNDPTLGNQVLALLVTPQKGQNGDMGILEFYATQGGVSAKWLVAGSAIVNNNFVIVKTASGLFEIWAKNYDGNRGLSFIRLTETNWGSLTNHWIRDLTTKDANFDPTTYDAYAYPLADQIVHTYGVETIDGAKTFTGTMLATGQPAYSASLPATTVATIGTLDAYTPMVRTTGNQEIIGIKAFSMPNYGYTLAVKDTGLDITNIQAQRVHTIPFLDKNGVGIANIRYVVQTTGEVLVQLEMRKTDGTFKYVNLGDNN